MHKLNQKNGNYNFFKLVASLVIVFFHVANYTVFYTKIPYYFKNGNMWVNFFLLTSAFLMTKKYYTQKFILNVYLKKIIYIYILYLLGLIPFIILKNIEIKTLMIDLMLMKAFFFKDALVYNGPTWYLSVYLFSIITFKIFLKILKKSTFIFIILIIFNILNIFYFYQIFYEQLLKNKILIDRFILYFPLSKLPFFLIGMLLYKLTKNIKKSDFSYAIIIYLFFIYKNNYIIKYTNFKLLNEYVYFILVFLPLIFFLEKDEGFFSKITSNKYLNKISELSIYIYIFHIPMLLVYAYFFGRSINHDFYFFRYLLLLLLFCTILKFIEKKIKNIYLKGKIKVNEDK